MVARRVCKRDREEERASAIDERPDISSSNDFIS